MFLSPCVLTFRPPQITAVRRWAAAATGLCEGGSGLCGKAGSGESASSPARCWSDPGPSAGNSSTSPIGCRPSSAWQEGATPRGRWTGSTCGTQSGELSCVWESLCVWERVCVCENWQVRVYQCERYRVLNVWQPAPPPTHLVISLCPSPWPHVFFPCRSPSSFNKPFVTGAMGAQREGNSISHSHTTLQSSSPPPSPLSSLHPHRASLLLDELISLAANPFMWQHTWEVVKKKL